MSGHYIEDIDKQIITYNNSDFTHVVSAVYKIRKPDNTLIEIPCSIIDVKNGITSAITNDLNLPGLYYIQTIVTFDNGKILSSVSQEFRMEERV